MALKAKKPESQPARFQALVYANRGVGKTHFCCSFPNSYFIDTEGVEKYPHFVEMLKANGSVIIRLNDMHDIVNEVKELISTKHEFKTIIIDSLTFPVHLLSNMETERLAKSSGKEGTEYGANLAKAKRLTFDLGMLLSRADLNCIVTAHEKTKYDKSGEVGKISDANEKIEYALGTVLNLRRYGEKIKVFIEKSRYPELKTFQLLDFDNGYQALCDKLGKGIFEREVITEELATPEQLIEFKRLKEVMHMSEDDEQRYCINARASCLEQINKNIMQKYIDYLIKKLTGEKK